MRVGECIWEDVTFHEFAVFYDRLTTIQIGGTNIERVLLDKIEILFVPRFEELIDVKVWTPVSRLAGEFFDDFKDFEFPVEGENEYW